MIAPDDVVKIANIPSHIRKAADRPWYSVRLSWADGKVNVPCIEVICRQCNRPPKVRRYDPHDPPVLNCRPPTTLQMRRYMIDDLDFGEWTLWWGQCDRCECVAYAAQGRKTVQGVIRERERKTQRAVLHYIHKAIEAMPEREPARTACLLIREILDADVDILNQDRVK